MKTVMAFGTFDGIHPGHESYLRQAKKYGDRLIVVIARDSTVKEIKGGLPKRDELVRLEDVSNIEEVDEAVLGNKGNKYKIIKDLRPDVICLGYDEDAFTQNLEKVVKKLGLSTEVKRMDAFQPNKYKSSLLNKQNGNR